MSERAFMMSALALALALSTAVPGGARKTVRPNLDRLARGKGWKVF